MSRWNLGWLITVPMFVVLGLTLSFGSPTKSNDKDYQLVRTIVDVLAEVDQKYVKELSDEDRKKFVENMINGGLHKLDPHSSYLNSDQYKEFEVQYEGKFGGIGVQLGVDEETGALKILSTLEGEPADKSGILDGDLIVKIDDQPAPRLNVNEPGSSPAKTTEAMKMILGKPGTPVKLTVEHAETKKIETITIERATIKLNKVLGWKRKEKSKAWEWFVERGIGYVHLTGFNESTHVDLKDVVERLEKEGAKALVLDLRSNPGGLLSQAVEVSDLFLTEGKIVSTKSRNDQRSWDAKAEGTLFQPSKNRPIAVLINRDSASASEIVAAALQDNNRAVIVGERSYGKGSVQKIIRLSKENEPPTALKLTTEKWFRPNGQSIQRDADNPGSEGGVKPTEGFEVPMTDEEFIASLRHQRAIEMPSLIAGKKDKKDEKPYQDKVLEKAVEYLKKEIGP